MGLAEDIKRQFPELYWLLSDPEVGKLLRQAVDPNSLDWSPERFKAELYGTKWWRTRSAANRNWEILYHTDPDTARERRRTLRTDIYTLAHQLGVSTTLAQRNWLTEWALGNGLTIDSLQLKQAIVRLWDKADKYRGSIGTDSQDIMNMARGEYFRPMSSTDANRLARNIAYGTDTLESVRTRLQQQAADRFPHMKKLIDAGQTPGQILQSHRELVAQELELGGIGEVDVMGNVTWRKLLDGVKEPKGERRMMTDSEVIHLARQQSRWWQTRNGKKTDAAFATGLLEAFGKRR